MKDINNIKTYDYGNEDLENKLIAIFSRSGPPDFDTADELLRLGADVNAEGKRDYNNILSNILHTYPIAAAKDPVNAGRHMIQVIQYFLDHGFDVHKNNGRYGAQCLKALVFFQEQPVIEATKLLFNAGAEDICTETTQNENGYPSYSLGAEISYQSICETNYRISNTLEAAYQVYQAKKNHKPYDDIDSYEDAIGKQIKKVLIEKPKKGKALHDVILKNGRFGKCFYTKIFFLFNDRMMIASPDVDFWTDKYDPSIQTIDISSLFSEIIGSTIESVEFNHSSVQTKRANYIQPVATFIMNNEKKITFSTSFGEVSDDTVTAYFYFGQPIARKKNDPGVEIWWC